ncbi:hypothetical protein ACH0B6_18355 [Solibacillus silvestris]
MITKTIEEIRKINAEMQKQKDEHDMERGYCKLDFPSVSDVWSYECYQKHWTVIKPLLVDYAALVLANGEFIPLGKDDQVNEWIRQLEVAGETKDEILSAKCSLLAHIYLPPLIKGESKLPPEKYAEIIAKKAADYPYTVYDKYVGDYDGNYDEYYKQKREELDVWQSAQ